MRGYIIKNPQARAGLKIEHFATNYPGVTYSHLQNTKFPKKQKNGKTTLSIVPSAWQFEYLGTPMTDTKTGLSYFTKQADMVEFGKAFIKNNGLRPPATNPKRKTERYYVPKAPKAYLHTTIKDWSGWPVEVYIFKIGKDKYEIKPRNGIQLSQLSFSMEELRRVFKMDGIKKL